MQSVLKLAGDDFGYYNVMEYPFVPEVLLQVALSCSYM